MIITEATGRMQINQTEHLPVAMGLVVVSLSMDYYRLLDPLLAAKCNGRKFK